MMTEEFTTPTGIIELTPRRRWVPFGNVAYYSGGHGPFKGYGWRYIPIIDGRRDPGLPDGIAWARTHEKALAAAKREAGIR